MTQGHGPDDYEIDITCPACKGTSVIAAPDAAAMVKQFVDSVVLKFRGPYRTDFDELHKLLTREAAALIEKLGRQVAILQAAHDLGWAHKTCPNCGSDMMTAATRPPPERP